jgi:hypothetical protein
MRPAHCASALYSDISGVCRRAAFVVVAALLALWPACAQDVEGRVVEDSSGAGVASAELRFHKAGMRELAADLETDRQGRFSASELAPGEYTVDISKPNYIGTALRLRVPATGLLLRLVRYGVISGQVTNAQGQPVPGRISAAEGRTVGSARIAVLKKGSERSIREVALAEDGHYRIRDLPPGQYTLGLWYGGLNEGSGMQLHPQSFTVTGGEEFRDIDFLIVPRAAFRVSGKVVLPTPGVTFALALGLPEQPALPVSQALTQADGSFSFAKIPAGTYDLYAAGPENGYGAFDSALDDVPFFGRARVEVTGADVEGLEVPVAAGRSIAVVLQGPAGGPPPEGCPPSAAVTLTALEPWGAMVTGKVQAAFGKGQAARNLAPGRYRLTAAGLGGACYQAGVPVVDLSGETAGPATVQLATAGSIRGVLSAGSARAADFVVVLLDAAGAQTQLAFADAEGRFRFEGLAPGRYRIAASRGRWVGDLSHMVEIEIPGGAPTDVELPVIPPTGERP